MEPIKIKKNIFSSQNRDTLLVLILYVIGAGISLYNQTLMENVKDLQYLQYILDSKLRDDKFFPDYEISELREKIEKLNRNIKLVTYLSIVKIILVGLRLFISNGLGKTASSINTTINLSTILLLNNGASVDGLETSINYILNLVGKKVLLSLFTFIFQIQNIDFWVHIIGMANIIAPLPALINKLLTIAIILTQIPINST